jgi:hypothetical protein
MTESEIKQLAEECRELAGRIHAPFKAMRSRGPTGGGNVYWWVESWNNLFTYTDAKGRLFGQKIATIDHGCAGEDEANLFAHAGTNYYRIADALEHMQHQLADVTRERDELKAGLDEANAAIDSVIDKVVNAKCVYCDWEGKRFGILEDPDRSKNNAMLAEHVKVCPKHPMRELERKLDEATRRAEEAEAARLRAIGRHSEVCQELADAEIDAEEAKAHLARMREALLKRAYQNGVCIHCGAARSRDHLPECICNLCLSLSPATPVACPNCERMRDALQDLYEYASEHCFVPDEKYYLMTNAAQALSGVTPPCPPGHCEECTGDCPDGAPAASEQASSEDARQKELDDALASVGFKKLVSGVSPMQGYMMMKAASEQAPAQESK